MSTQCQYKQKEGSDLEEADGEKMTAAREGEQLFFEVARIMWRGYYGQRRQRNRQTERRRDRQTKRPVSRLILSVSLIALSLCLHLHSTLNKVFRDTWQVAWRGAEFQSAPS